jgi:hypothetical protein
MWERRRRWPAGSATAYRHLLVIQLSKIYHNKGQKMQACGAAQFMEKLREGTRTRLRRRWAGEERRREQAATYPAVWSVLLAGSWNLDRWMEDSSSDRMTQFGRRRSRAGVMAADKRAERGRGESGLKIGKCDGGRSVERFRFGVVHEALARPGVGSTLGKHD